MANCPNCGEDDHILCRPLTKREERRYSRQAAWRYDHRRAPRYRHCRRWWCFRCHRDMLLGRQRRTKNAMIRQHREMMAAQKRLADACDHEWVIKTHSNGNEMARCFKCHSNKWTKFTRPEQSGP